MWGAEEEAVVVLFVWGLLVVVLGPTPTLGPTRSLVRTLCGPRVPRVDLVGPCVPREDFVCASYVETVERLNIYI